MLCTFLTLKYQYESQELTIDDLRVLQQYQFIQFKNMGISRSNLDCLHWEITCLPYANFLNKLTTNGFASSTILSNYIIKSGLDLAIDENYYDSLVYMTNCDKKVEIIANIATDSTISMDVDDIELQPSFKIFLRVQH